jgi:hypothetical protein
VVDIPQRTWRRRIARWIRGKRALALGGTHVGTRIRIGNAHMRQVETKMLFWRTLSKDVKKLEALSNMYIPATCSIGDLQANYERVLKDKNVEFIRN